MEVIANRRISKALHDNYVGQCQAALKALDIVMNARRHVRGTLKPAIFGRAILGYYRVFPVDLST